MLDDSTSRIEKNKRAYCKTDYRFRNATEQPCCFPTRNQRDILDESKLYCCQCAHKRQASPLTCIGICVLVLTYNMIGGFLFYSLERDTSQLAEVTAVAASKPNLSHNGPAHELRSRTVEKLWSITEDLNILYKENWTKLAAKELIDFQRVLIKTIRGDAAHETKGYNYQSDDGDYRWTLSSSFLYALTLITTIGHGNVAPKSAMGKVAALAYACIGIPIIMLYLSTIGEVLARHFRILYSKICPARIKSHNFHPKSDCLHRSFMSGHEFKRNTVDFCNKRSESLDAYNDLSVQMTPFQAALNLNNFKGGYHWTCRDHTRVPIILTLFLIVLYIALGTFVFNKTEKWSLIDGCYFSISSLATVGFGDLRPGLYASTISAKAEDIAVGICCIYLLVGIVVIAMCFNLIQEDLSAGLRSITAVCTGTKSRAVHNVEKILEDGTPMSVVS